MRIRAAFLTILALMLTLPGCGGEGSSGSSTKSAAAIITIQWPERTRLIPEAASSILIAIQDGSTPPDQQLVARPAAGGSTSVTFNSLPVGNFTITATAFPNADGTGTALATAMAPIALAAGQSTTFSLTMSSTIAKLNLTVPTNQITAGGTVQLGMTAVDASGAVVLTSPDKIVWRSSDSTLATVDNTGKVTGVLMGTPTITVTDTESGKSASTPITVQLVITVQPASTTLTLGNLSSFMASVVGSANTAVTWTVAEGAAGGTIDASGMYTAPQQPGVFHVIATSQADASKSSTATVTVQAGNSSVTIQ